MDIPSYLLGKKSSGGGGGGGQTTAIFTGHYDKTGLKAIGWSDEEVKYYQDNGVQWNEESDNGFKLNASELAGDTTPSTRFYPSDTSFSDFSDYTKLLAIPLIDTSNKTDLQRLFYNCYNLTAVPLLDTSKATSTGNMFSSCYSILTIPLIDTSKSTNMGSMFAYCYSLKTIPLIDTSSCEMMSFMFRDCKSLKAIPQLNTSKVYEFSNMFSGCSSLEYVPVLDTSRATSVNRMFFNCTNLTNEAVNNILEMCINMEIYTGTKTLSSLGLQSSYYPASMIQNLSNYDDFIDADWTIGY